MNTLIVGDIHGSLKELQQLVAQTQPDLIYSVGDLIDRGPKSKAVVDYCAENRIKVCLGNHELMFIEAIGAYLATKDKVALKFTDWWVNGGEQAFKDYTDTDLLRHLEYFKSLPTWYLLPEKRNDKQIVVSHSMITQYVDDLADIGPTYNEIGDQMYPLVWNRDRKPNKSSKYFNIHGHSPTDWYAALDNEPLLTDWQLNLDTGCAYKSINTRGSLTGVLLPSFEIVQIKDNE